MVLSVTTCGRTAPSREVTERDAESLAQAQRLRLLVPAYFLPGAEWEVLRDAAGAVGMVILNPASGPGERPDEGYRSAAGRLRDAGIDVIGYVDTAYGARDTVTVLAEVEKHRRWYAADGVFYDQVGNDCGLFDYHMKLADGARVFGCESVVMNTGDVPCECLLFAADVVCSAENEMGAYLATGRGAGWERRHDAARFCHLVHGATGIGGMRDVVAAARARHAGWVFATSLPVAPLRSGDVAPNPWAGLPDERYWSALLEAL